MAKSISNIDDFVLTAHNVACAAVNVTAPATSFLHAFLRLERIKN